MDKKLLIEKRQFDVILMDIHTPIMGGYDAPKAIRKMSDTSKSDVHSIALTASFSHNTRATI
jgi:CheY-like chemotaxis protein